MRAGVAGVVAAAALAGPPTASAATVTVAPSTPAVASGCFPFGLGGGGAAWTPFLGFVYMNLPAFSLAQGDTLAFDTANQNEVDDRFTIGLVPTTANGGDLPAGAYTNVVTNTQVATNPRGNTTVGDYEMQFKLEVPFNFPGGGLIMRFSSPAGPYAGDASCTPTNITGDSTDPSGLFVKRFRQDADGLPPYPTQDPGAITGFRVSFADPPAPPSVAVPRCNGKEATIVGTNAAETLLGTKRADVITSLGGNDKVAGRRGKDLICAGDGKDSVTGGSASDRLKGEAGKDLLRGGRGRDRLKGGPGADTLIGGKAIDTVNGGPGVDSVKQ